MFAPLKERVDWPQDEAEELTEAGTGLVGFDDCYFKTAMIFFELV